MGEAANTKCMVGSQPSKSFRKFRKKSRLDFKFVE